MNWRVSATQIEAVDPAHDAGCERRFAFNYVMGLKPPQHPAAALGGELHKFGEGYLRDGKAPDDLTVAGNLFLYGLPYLPPPRSGGVEGDIQSIEIDGVRYNGYIDYRGPRVPGVEGRCTLDHKTSSNPKKWGLWTLEKFLSKPQPILYGSYDVLRSEADGEEDRWSNLRWLYYWTKGKPRAEPSDVRLTRAMLEDNFERVVGNPAKRILQIIESQPDPNDLTPNYRACDKFPKARDSKGPDGCPYHPRNGGGCKIERMKSVAAAFGRKKEEMKMPVNEKLMAKLRRAEAPKDPINPPEAELEEEEGEEDEAPAPEPPKPAKPTTTRVRASAGKEEGRTSSGDAPSAQSVPREEAPKGAAHTVDMPSNEEVGRVVCYLIALVCYLIALVGAALQPRR